MFITELFSTDNQGKKLVAVFHKGPTLNSPKVPASKIYLWKTGTGDDTFEMEVGQEKKRIPVTLSFAQIRQVLAQKGFTESIQPEGKLLIEANTAYHRVSVTVSDPNHPAVTQRKEKVQKTIRVKGDEAGAVQKAVAYYKKKGFKVHDANYIEGYDIASDVSEAINEGYILKRTSVDKRRVEPDEQDEWHEGPTKIIDTTYDIIHNKTGKVVGTASCSTNDYFGRGSMQITMNNGATRWVDLWDRDDSPQAAFNRFVKQKTTANKYKEIPEASMTKSIPAKKDLKFHSGVEKLLGQQVAIVTHEYPDMVAYGTFKRIGETGLCHVKLNGGKLKGWAAGDMIAVAPNELYAPWDTRLQGMIAVHREYDDQGNKTVREDNTRIPKN